MAVFIVPSAPTGQTTRFRVVRLSDGQLWNVLTGAFEAYNAANWTATKYMVSMTEQGSSGTYSGTFPAVTSNTRVALIAHQDASAGNPAPTDAAVWSEAYRWDGTTLYALDAGNVTHWLGTEVPASTIPGYPDVNAVQVDTEAISSGSFAAGAINANAIATDAIGGLELSAGAANEVAVAVWANLDAAGVRTALGMASADMDDQLDAIASKTALISSGGNTFRSPFQNGTLVIPQTSDYTNQASAITIAQDGGNWPTSFTGYTVTLHVKPTAKAIAAGASATVRTFTGTVSGSSPSFVLSFRPVTGASGTSVLVPDGTYHAGPSSLAQVWATHATNPPILLFSGLASVVDDVRS